MKIVIVTLEYLPHGISGNGIYAKIVVDALKLNHNVMVATSVLSDAAPQSEIYSVPVSALRGLDDIENMEFIVEGLKRIEGLYKFNPDMVIGVDWHSIPICLALLGTCDCKFVWMPFRIYSYSNKSKTIENLEKLGVSNAHAIIALSDVDSKLIKGLFGYSAVVVSPPLSEKMFSESKDAKHLRRDIILVISRVSPEKHIENIIRALPKVDPNLSLIVAGHISDKEYEEGLRALSRRLGVEERVAFLGRLSQRHIVELYSHAKVYVNPSTYEPFGLSIVEAAAFKLPIVMDNSGLIGAGIIFKDQKSCVKTEVSNPKKLAEVINTVAEDLELAGRIGGNACKTVLEMTQSKFTAKLNEIIWEVVKN
jgi:glycosyltransferase involved in cell wall biosynthesis